MAIKVRRGPDAQRLLVVLEDGEIAYATDTKKFYVGDGVTLGGNEVTGANHLYDMLDVNIFGPAIDQLLKYDGTHWINWSPTFYTLPSGGTTSDYIDGTGAIRTFPTLAQADRLVTEVRNETGSPVVAGTVIYLNGASGNKPLINLAQANAEATSTGTYGVVRDTINNNQNGYVVVIGTVYNLNTSSYAAGTILWLSPTVAGGFTTTKPSAPNHAVYVAIVTRSHATQGTIEVKIQNGYELQELHNVAISSVANNDGLFYEAATSLWKNKSIPTVLGYTPADAAKTLTVNGVTYDLTANRSWSVGDLLSTGSYSNPTWITSLAWSKITGTPTTISGYGITDGVSTGGSYANPTWLTSLAWGKITSTPTTLSGYGITDGVSTSGSYSNPSWITDLAFSKITGYSVPTLDQVTTAGNTTTNGINIGTLTVGTNKLVVFPTTGNIGINTLIDAGYKLDLLGGDVRLNGVRIGLGNGSQTTNMAVGFEALNANSTGIGITAIGYQAFKNGTVSYNTAIGYQSQINGGGQNNTSVGYLTLTAGIFGSSANTAIGHTALRYLVSGSNNTSVGSDAQQNVTSGSDNTSVGVTTLYNNLSGSRNSAFGVGALYSFTNNESVAFGYYAALNLTTPIGTIAIGAYALNSATTSPQNTAVGYQSQRYGNNATGQNTSVGYNTFSNASFNGSRNTAVGALAGVALTTGNTNAFFGYLAGTAATSSSNNTLIGSSAGSTLSAGSNNTLVGALTVTTGSSNAILGTGGSASTFSACVVLGREATATGSNQFVVGSTTYPAGTVTAAVAPIINEYWTVIINGVSKKIALIA